MRIKASVAQAPAVGAALLLALLQVPAASGQSLGDVARREEERRKQTASGRVYTNESLGSPDAVSPPATPAAPPEAAVAGADSPPAPTAKDGVIIEEDRATGTTNVRTAPMPSRRGEQYWRDRMRELRGRVARTDADIAAQEARLAELDGNASPAATRERDTIASSLATLRKVRQVQSNELDRATTQANVEKVPEEWLR